MREINVTANEAGQRLDKLLARYLREAPKSFLYKMMRKKNITLNGKKAQGNEIVNCGDTVKLFLAEETIAKFQGKGGVRSGENASLVKLDIVYEDEHIVLINKPAGMLSQKAKADDISLVEYLTEYLLESGSISMEEAALVRPAVCNRLDRNTSGLVVAGKSLPGLQTMSLLLKDRSLRKYYRCIVKGELSGKNHLKGYLTKDGASNRVSIAQKPRSGEDKPIETEYEALACANGLTMLEVHLITGRSHQIRAHLSSIGHPILGDMKYGDEELNRRYRKSHNVRSQLLHAYRLELPEIEGPLSYLSGRTFYAELPPLYRGVMEGAPGKAKW